MLEDEDIVDLIRKVQYEQCTVEEAEQIIAELRKRNPYFDASDEMLQLEDGTRIRKRADELASAYPERMTREQLIALVKRGVHVFTVEERIGEFDALSDVFVRNVPNMPEASASTLFSSALSGRKSAEEIVEQALAYRPIQL